MLLISGILQTYIVRPFFTYTPSVYRSLVSIHATHAYSSSLNIYIYFEVWSKAKFGNFLLISPLPCLLNILYMLIFAKKEGFLVDSFSNYK